MDGNINENYEQEMILRKKIEKREKIDTILAYILIVILLACIGIILYLKFVRKEEDTHIDEYVPNYVSLNYISSMLNTSTLVNDYISDGASFSSNVSGNSIVVTYTKDNVVLNLNIPVVSNELVINIPSENTELVTDIYREIASIICVYYGNDESSCKNTVNNITIEDSSISGIRFVNDNTVYIDITESIEVSSGVVKTSINDTNYILDSTDIKISNIIINNSEDAIMFTGIIDRVTDEKYDFSLVVKLYDINDALLDEYSLEYKSDDVLDGNSGFSVFFSFSDTLKLENINKYSIEIVK